MSDITVTPSDVESLAGKLDGMTDQFSAQERATLQAVWRDIRRKVDVPDMPPTCSMAASSGSARPVEFSICEVDEARRL